MDTHFCVNFECFARVLEMFKWLYSYTPGAPTLFLDVDGQSNLNCGFHAPHTYNGYIHLTRQLYALWSLKEMDDHKQIVRYNNPSWFDIWIRQNVQLFTKIHTYFI